MNTIECIAQKARLASRQLVTTSATQRNLAITYMANALEEVKSEVLSINAQEVISAREKGQSEPMIKRLTLDLKMLDYMLSRLRKLTQLPDPLNRVLAGHTNPQGLRVYKKSVPLGVIGIIYESRPNVTTDAAGVCIKSGNAVILRGGSEAISTNTLLTQAMASGIAKAGLPEHAIQIIPVTGHEAVTELLAMDNYIDVLIPRGGKGLIERIAQGTRIPVIKHYDGICHLYIAADADIDQALALAINSKCQSVQVCNALETLLVDAACAAKILPEFYKHFSQQKIELRGCVQTRQYLPNIALANEADWETEYLAPILAIKLVANIDEAIAHINTYGSGHTDGIVTQSLAFARQFEEQVDSASVMINASTRLSGGGDYGLGAVVGISTDKLHVRGPVGADNLTSYKWVAYGNGHLRD